MKINWKEFNSNHLECTTDAHIKLVSYVHDNPNLTYEEYVAKAKSLGIVHVSEGEMNRWGLCKPVPEAVRNEVTGVE